MSLAKIVPLFLLGIAACLATGRAEEAANYRGPCALVVSGDGRTLYVANADGREVAWVELPGGNVTRRIAVPGEPTGLALSPDGTRLIVTCASPKSTVAVFAAGSGKLTAAIPAGHTAMSPAISPDGKRLYVCNRFNHDVSVIDLAAAREVARIGVVREPVAAAVAPDGRSVWVANQLPYARTDRRFDFNVRPVVTVIDTRTQATTAIPLAHGANSLRGLCITPDGKYALVTHLLSNFESATIRVDGGWINTNVVSVIDASQRKVFRTIGLDYQSAGAGNPWSVACTADAKSVCVSISGTHELSAIDLADLLSESGKLMTPTMGVWPIYPGVGDGMWRRIKLPGKGPRGLAIAGSRAFAAQYFSDSVAVVDLQSADDTPAGEIALGPAPKLTEQRRGELLFHDATICTQRWQSCASCHPDGRADGLNWDLMNDGEGNPKNTKSLLLAHATPPAMWEGVRMSAEEAVRSGIEHIFFARRPEEEAAAIDVYLKSLRPVPSPHLVDGRLSPAAARGQVLFNSERTGCSRCHPAPLYTDLKAHNVGSRGPNDFTNRFDTPTLIEVWRTAPYLHNGRYTTIRELLAEGRHGMNDRHRLRTGETTTVALPKGTVPFSSNENWDSPPLDPAPVLSEQEMSDLVEFVLSL
jgi:YVTN family beta-propeller protein